MAKINIPTFGVAINKRSILYFPGKIFILSLLTTIYFIIYTEYLQEMLP